MGRGWVAVGVLMLAGCLLPVAGCSEEVCREALATREAEVSAQETAFWQVDATLAVFEGLIADVATGATRVATGATRVAATLQAERTRCTSVGPRPTASPSPTARPSASATLGDGGTWTP